jgi:phospholipid/cholesterol/gamma-HCH transport system substrate-binding protein
MKLTKRIQNIISGLCAIVVLLGVSTIGVKFSFGAYDQGYELRASFDAAGQGLSHGSDVKIRGINIGHVDSIHLVDGRAEVIMFIDAGHDIPRDADFAIRPKTLFGEKFVDIDPGPGEVGGEMFDPGGTLDERTVANDHAVGGIELERVLSNLYPILQAIDPGELATILDTLAAAGDDLGPTINRSIVNTDQVLAVTAARDAETRQFLEALAQLTGELSVRAPDLIAGAEDLNAALPVLTQNRQSFTALLEQTERVSGQLADVLEGNTAFIDSVYTDGQRTLDTLFDHRVELIPLVTGLREYVQTLAEAGRIPVGDGTVMAAVKGLLGGQICDVFIGIPCTGAATNEITVSGAESPSTPAASDPAPPGVPEPTEGTQSIVDLMTGALGLRTS